MLTMGHTTTVVVATRAVIPVATRAVIPVLRLTTHLRRTIRLRRTDRSPRLMGKNRLPMGKSRHPTDRRHHPTVTIPLLTRVIFRTSATLAALTAPVPKVTSI